MTNITPYSRKVKVAVGPMDEWQGGGDERLSSIIWGDGSQEGFRVKFDVHKHVVSTATPTVIQVYNLSQGFRNALRKPGIQVALWVGWANTDMYLLFTGSLLAAVHQRQGSEIVTNLISNAAWGGMARTVVSETWSGGIDIQTLVTDLARKIPGVTVDTKNIVLDKRKRIGGQGWSFAGPVNEAIDRLARVHGFSWGVDNKIFRAIMDGQPLSNERVTLGGGSLFRVEPMLAGPMQQRTGVSISCLLNPWVKAGSLVTIQSILNPALDGNYVVHNLTHSGDTHGTQWDTRIQSWVVVG